MLTDENFKPAGATSCPTAAQVWGDAEMVIKVKEPIAQEYGFLREGLILYTYLHLAAVPELAQQLTAKKVTGLAYDTIEIETVAAAAHADERGRGPHGGAGRRAASAET